MQTIVSQIESFLVTLPLHIYHFTILDSKHWRIQGGRQGHPQAQFVSCSCSFCAILAKIMGCRQHISSWHHPPGKSSIHLGISSIAPFQMDLSDVLILRHFHFLLVQLSSKPIVYDVLFIVYQINKVWLVSPLTTY